MYKLGGRRKIGRKASHRRSMIKNQVRSLLLSGSVVTTTQKAKILKANASSYLSGLTKLDPNHAKAQLFDLLGDDKAAEKISKYIVSDHAVGIVKVGYRDGDNAQQSKVSLLNFAKAPVKSDAKKVDEPKKDAKKVEDDAKASKGFVSEKANDKANMVAKNIKNKVVGSERSRTRSGL